ncbi:MAG: hypothetical protein COA58_13365 [Bacteroidetes bacterium]|nr:MAG: hypothetical protein COA58_13365 [Bacteroidota bacterium]
MSLGQSVLDSLRSEGICDSTGYCIPSIDGLPKPKGFELKYRRIRDYEIKTKIGENRYTGRVDRNRETTIKLILPVVRKDHFMMALGAKYEVEEFRFDNHTKNNNSFYKYLEDKPLRSVGLTAYMGKSLIGDKFIMGRVNTRLSGDIDKSKLINYFRSTVSIIYGQKRSSTISWGVGLTYNNTFGRQLVLPVLSYNRRFTDKLSTRILLPVDIQFNYLINEKNVLRWSNKLSGDNYYINSEPIATQNFYLSKSDFFSTLAYERELYDFIWVSTNVGYHINYKFDLSTTNKLLSTDASAISNSVQNAFSFQISLFFVPPKKWK